MLRLRDIMTRDVFTLPRDTTIREALEKLSANHKSAAPVVFEGKVVGLVSVADIVGVIAQAPEAESAATAGTKTVGKVMTGEVFSLPPDAPVRNAASMMREKRIHRVLVMSDDQLEGIVSSFDVARAVSDVGVTGSDHAVRKDEGDPSPWLTC
jgi:CBS-domain-containing membrane protein